jgi:hypothetical protein
MKYIRLKYNHVFCNCCGFGRRRSSLVQGAAFALRDWGTQQRPGIHRPREELDIT